MGTGADYVNDGVVRVLVWIQKRCIVHDDAPLLSVGSLLTSLGLRYLLRKAQGYGILAGTQPSGTFTE